METCNMEIECYYLSRWHDWLVVGFQRNSSRTSNLWKQEKAEKERKIYKNLIHFDFLKVIWHHDQFQFRNYYKNLTETDSYIISAREYRISTTSLSCTCLNPNNLGKNKTEPQLLSHRDLANKEMEPAGIYCSMCHNIII